MRELTSEELDLVSGGSNLVAFAAVAIKRAGHFGTGVLIGQGINAFNEHVTGMSLGDAIFRAAHTRSPVIGGSDRRRRLRMTRNGIG